MTILEEILQNGLDQWLEEDRTLDDIKAEMRVSIAYIQDMQAFVTKAKAAARQKGQNPSDVPGMKAALLKNDKKKGENLSGKISKDEYLLGKHLQALLGRGKLLILQR